MPSVMALYPNVPPVDLNASMILMRANREDARLAETRMPVQSPLDVLAVACAMRDDYESDGDTIVDENFGDHGESAKFSIGFLKSSVQSRVVRQGVALRSERPVVNVDDNRTPVVKAGGATILMTYDTFTQEGDSVEEGAAGALFSIQFSRTGEAAFQNILATGQEQTPVALPETEYALPVTARGTPSMEHTWDLSSMRETQKLRWSPNITPPEKESATAMEASSASKTTHMPPCQPRQTLVWTIGLPPPPPAAAKRAKPHPKSKAEKELDIEAKDGIWKSKLKQRNTRNSKDCEVDGHQEGFDVHDTGAVRTAEKKRRREDNVVKTDVQKVKKSMR